MRGQNPFYLLSAGCMLTASYLLSGASSEAPHDVWHLLPILGSLNLYELLLVGLGVFLCRRGLVRDGGLLLVLEGVFLADLTHLSAETVTRSGALWPLAAALLLAASAAKVALVALATRVPLRALRLARVAPAAALVLFLPGAIAAIARTGTSLDLTLYGAAWVLGLVLVLQAVGPAAPRGAALTLANPATQSFHRGLRLSLLASAAAHVLALHWMYDIEVRFCGLSPALLAAALAVVRHPDAEDVPRLRVLVPALAVLFSMGAPRAFVFASALGVFSPFRAAIVVAALVYLYDYARHRQTFTLAFAGACGMTALAGHGPGVAYDRIAHGLDLLLPRTREHWGRVALLAAYALLPIGLWRSLRPARPAVPPRR